MTTKEIHIKARHFEIWADEIEQAREDSRRTLKQDLTSEDQAMAYAKHVGRMEAIVSIHAAKLRRIAADLESVDDSKLDTAQ